VRYEVLGIGASTGGPRALHEILQHFPKNFPSPILVVQHIAKAFIEGLVNWINKDSELSVKIAKQGEKLKPATVYLAPPDLHLLVRNEGRKDHCSGPGNLPGFRDAGFCH